MKRIAVFGLGKVGSILAVCLARAGHRVVGVDVSPTRVEAINARRLDTFEPHVSELLRALPADALTATADVDLAVAETELAFVIVQTPTNILGGFSCRYVLDACQKIGEALRALSHPYVLSLVSTVLPGSSDRLIIQRLERASGRRLGQGLGYCYNPSFIALGEVVKGFQEPDYVLIGESDKASGDIVLETHRSMLTREAPVARMRPVEAEIAKIASNTHETMRVSFANMLFSLCSEIPGANVDHITDALTHRMGKRFFKGATPFGGPCWPRDNLALTAFMDAVGTPSTIPREVDRFNREHAKYILLKVLELSQSDDVIAILGLSYKPGTSFLDCAFGLDLARWCVAEGRRVVAWDPQALDDAASLDLKGIELHGSAEDCLRQANLAVVTLPLKELSQLDWTSASSSTVVDCWRCLSAEAIAAVGRYHPLGVGPDMNLNDWLEHGPGKTLDLLTN